jgi:rSAM/selenodomain-associated transferase 1
MAKASAPGRAKTRLVPPLTFDEAADLNTAFLQDVAENLILAGERARAGAAENPPIVGYAAYGPPGSADFFRRILPGSIGLIEAWLPNFGDCLFHTIRQILARGHVSAVVLNSDSPTLPTAFLVETAELLARPGDRAVLGPSADGGYYLLGLKHPHARMFEEITWSTERVAQQTLARAREIGLDMHVLPAWYDVDDIDALKRLDAELRGADLQARRQGSPRPRFAAHTAELMRQLARERDFGRAAGRAFAADQIHA